MTREQSYLIIGLKSLGYLKFREKSGRKAVYDCLKCNVRIEKKKISMHFRFNHSDIYHELRTLIQKWGLVSGLESEETELHDMEIQEKRFFCSCGLSYSSSANLSRHRRKHREVESVESGEFIG